MNLASIVTIKSSPISEVPKTCPVKPSADYLSSSDFFRKFSCVSELFYRIAPKFNLVPRSSCWQRLRYWEQWSVRSGTQSSLRTQRTTIRCLATSGSMTAIFHRRNKVWGLEVTWSSREVWTILAWSWKGVAACYRSWGMRKAIDDISCEDWTA